MSKHPQCGAHDFDDYPHSWWVALGIKLGGRPVIDSILRNETEVVFKDKQAIVQEADQPLFDHTGRCIPARGLKGKVVDTNRAFHLVQPKLDYAGTLAQYEVAFTRQAPFSVDEFRARIVDLMARIAADERCYNLLNGAVMFSLILPQINTDDKWDYGTELEGTFLPAVERAYKVQFPQRVFNNYRKGELAGKVTIAADTRHDLTVERMKAGAVVALYFPNPLQGFSIPADREQMEMLPSGFALAGAFEPTTALALYPETLARDYQTPGLDCSAVSWRSDLSLYFKADGGDLVFDYRRLRAGGDHSGGLVFLG